MRPRFSESKRGAVLLPESFRGGCSIGAASSKTCDLSRPASQSSSLGFRQVEFRVAYWQKTKNWSAPPGAPKAHSLGGLIRASPDVKGVGRCSVRLSPEIGTFVLVSSSWRPRGQGARPLDLPLSQRPGRGFWRSDHGGLVRCLNGRQPMRPAVLSSMARVQCVVTTSESNPGTALSKRAKRHWRVFPR